jgi:hypothetical protein
MLMCVRGQLFLNFNLYRCHIIVPLNVKHFFPVYVTKIFEAITHLSIPKISFFDSKCTEISKERKFQLPYKIYCQCISYGRIGLKNLLVSSSFTLVLLSKNSRLAPSKNFRWTVESFNSKQ